MLTKDRNKKASHQSRVKHVETCFEHFGTWFDVKEEILNIDSKYQNIKVIDTLAFGKGLVLNNEVRTLVKDEFIYHESMVHPAMMANIYMNKLDNVENKISVLIAGGGDLCILRELIKYENISKIILCELDKQVINVTLKYFDNKLIDCKKLNNEIKVKKRVEIVIDDAYSYLLNKCDKNTKFDLIIADLSDSSDDAPCFGFYCQEFYQYILNNRLKNNGVFVTQTGSVSPINEISLQMFCKTHLTIESVFGMNNTQSYCSFVPSYHSEVAFHIGYKNNSSKQKNMQIEQSIDIDIDNRLKKYLSNKVKTLKFYDGKAHLSMFSLPKYIRQQLNQMRINVKDSIITQSNLQAIVAPAKHKSKL